MKEYYKDEFKKLMQEYPEGGIVFTAVYFAVCGLYLVWSQMVRLVQQK